MPSLLLSTLVTLFFGCTADTEAEIIPEPLPRLEPEYILSDIEFLPSDEGFDLDGDGAPNNALASIFEDPQIGPILGGDPNEYIARSIQRSELLLLLDFYDFNDFQTDDSVNIDIFLGHDFDDNQDNNFDGTEFSITCSSLTEDNQPESQFFNATIQAGQLEGEDGQFRFLVSFSNTEVLLQGARITGTFDPEGQYLTGGMLGGAVTIEDLEEVVYNDPEIGSGFAQVMMAFLNAQLDTDIDGDGENDALSASFRFEALPAIIDRESACAE